MSAKSWYTLFQLKIDICENFSFTNKFQFDLSFFVDISRYNSQIKTLLSLMKVNLKH